MEGLKYNMKSPAVKRLMREAHELKDPTEQYYAQPLEDNLFEWHFTVRGPADSEFDSGIYHGRITLPADYPMKPPSIILLTPNGRFELNKKICLTISGHHPESWRPSWSIRTALLAIIGFMPSHGAGAIGSLDYTAEERRTLALRSQQWRCPSCAVSNSDILLPVSDASDATREEIRELASQIDFKGEGENGQSSKEGSDGAQNIQETDVRHRSVTAGQESSTNERKSETEAAGVGRPHITNQPMRVEDEEGGRNPSLLLMILVSLALAALLLRRALIYLEPILY